MNISRFEPWNLANLLHQDASQLAPRQRALRTVAQGNNSGKNWLPAVDILEEDSRFLLRADVPGVKAEDIDINLEKGVLSISGSRALDQQEEGQNIQRRERSNGQFLRRFSLPDTTDTDDVTATCADGILEIIIPKQPEVQARKITVKAA